MPPAPPATSATRPSREKSASGMPNLPQGDISYPDNPQGALAMGTRLVDLSMPVHNDMITFPRIVRPALVMYESWQQFAERIGAAKYGVNWLTAHYLIVIGD